MGSAGNLGKYESGNPVVRRLVTRFVGAVVDRALPLRPRRIADLGCGEGVVARRLRAALPDTEYWGVDRSEAALRHARVLNPGARFTVGDILDAREPEQWADLVVCLEVLEHLSDAEAGVDAVARWTAAHAIVSVPWEPWFRLGNLARGKHLSTLGNHPEHVQRFTPTGLGTLLERRFRTVKVHTVFPWLIAVAFK